MTPLLLPLLLALAASPARAGSAGDDVGAVDYPAILADARERYGLSEADLAGTSVAALLAGPHFLALEVGPFDLRFPVHSATDRGGEALLEEAVLHVLDLVDAWAAMKLVEKDAVEPVRADVARLRKWVERWSDKAFAQAARQSGGSLYERMGADEDVRAAADRLARALSPVHAERPGQAACVVIAPERRTFVELSTLAGALEPARREALWGAESAFYSAGWTQDVQLVALEYAAWPWDAGQPYLGAPMNELVKTGRRQHVVDRAAESLARAEFDALATPLVEQALRVELVIDVVGEEHPTFNTWSFQFSRAGGSTAPYSRFVPGGNSAGGTLPPRPAQAGPSSGGSSRSPVSPWRENDGKDRFREALAKGQKRGAKLAGKLDGLSSELRRDKRAHFAVGVQGKSDTAVVTAPFLGELAEQKPLPPKEFIDDYEELYRSYRVAFVHWLRTEGHPDGAKASPAAFARLLGRLRARSETDTLDALVRDVYGLPLSAPDGTADSLEWRFLAWLAR